MLINDEFVGSNCLIFLDETVQRNVMLIREFSRLDCAGLHFGGDHKTMQIKQEKVCVCY